MGGQGLVINNHVRTYCSRINASFISKCILHSLDLIQMELIALVVGHLYNKCNRIWLGLTDGVEIGTLLELI